VKRDNITSEQAQAILAGLAALDQRLTEADAAAERRAAADREERAEIMTKLGGLHARLDRVDPTGASNEFVAYTARRAEWERQNPGLAEVPPAGPGGMAERPSQSDVLTPREIAEKLGLSAGDIAAGLSGDVQQDGGRLVRLMAAVHQQAAISATMTHEPGSGRPVGDTISRERQAALARGEYDFAPARQPVDLGALAGTISYPTDEW